MSIVEVKGKDVRRDVRDHRLSTTRRILIDDVDNITLDLLDDISTRQLSHQPADVIRQLPQIINQSLILTVRELRDQLTTEKGLQRRFLLTIRHRLTRDSCWCTPQTQKPREQEVRIQACILQPYPRMGGDDVTEDLVNDELRS